MIDKGTGRSVAMMDFVEVLLPGDELFPSARDAGFALELMARLEAGGLLGRLEQVVAAVGESFGDFDAEARRAVVARVEAEQPALFADVLKIVYLTYYEQPAVIAAIRAMGLTYNTTPLPDGYPIEPFDPARDAPQHHRGRWIQTGDVDRVELSALEYVRRLGS
ncbi:MAG: hypothetical protein ACR2JE_14975 [Acidobacteriaceae bacterium]